jgi:phospholipid transport system substrate-binding protein
MIFLLDFAATAVEGGWRKFVRIRFLFWVVAAISTMVLAGTGQAADAAAEPAVKTIDAFHDTLVDVMKRGPSLGMEGRYKELEPKISATLDLAVMTKFTVGPTWSKIPESDQAALIAAFTRMTVATYAMNFDKFEGQKFVVDPKVEVRGTDSLVKSQVIPKGEKAVNLTYRMRNSGGSWKVIDVIYEHVSELATRRADFSTTLASGGAAALVKKLNAIADDLMKGKG